MLGRIEPAQPVGDAGLDRRVARPQGRIAVEQARGPCFGGRPAAGCCLQLGLGWGQPEAVRQLGTGRH
jgi:hypothetical protein